MSTIIRKNCFETNSSSSHTLVLDDSKSFPDYNFGRLSSDGDLTINIAGRFGWQWEIWNSAQEKFSYLWLDNEHHPDFRKRLIKIVKNGLNALKLEKVKNILIHVPEKDYDNYIDHQSAGTSSEISKLSDEEIWNFLVYSSNSIKGGNDNEDGPW